MQIRCSYYVQKNMRGCRGSCQGGQPCLPACTPRDLLEAQRQCASSTPRSCSEYQPSGVCGGRGGPVQARKRGLLPLRSPSSPACSLSSPTPVEITTPVGSMHPAAHRSRQLGAPAGDAGSGCAGPRATATPPSLPLLGCRDCSHLCSFRPGGG